MSTITIQRTLTEHELGKRFNKQTGKWEEKCKHDPQHGETVANKTMRGTHFRAEWHETDPPRTINYSRSDIPDMPFRGGTVRTEMTVEGNADVELTEWEVKRIASSLLTTYRLSTPHMAGLDHDQIREAVREQLAVEALLIKLGADLENLHNNLS